MQTGQCQGKIFIYLQFPREGGRHRATEGSIGAGQKAGGRGRESMGHGITGDAVGEAGQGKRDSLASDSTLWACLWLSGPQLWVIEGR